MEILQQTLTTPNIFLSRKTVRETGTQQHEKCNKTKASWQPPTITTKQQGNYSKIRTAQKWSTLEVTRDTVPMSLEI